MNVALTLTLLRLFSVPVVLLLLMSRGVRHAMAALAVYTVAALTDVVDGPVARARGEITTVGIMLDPIADKCLVITLLFAFAALGVVPLWMVVIIALREVAVTGTRLWYFAHGHALAARDWGKHKTAWQMVTVGVLLVVVVIRGLGAAKGPGVGRTVMDMITPAALVMMWGVLILSVISGIDFFVKLDQVTMGKPGRPAS